MACSKCGSDRMMSAAGKTSDMNSVGIEADGYDHDGYVPDNLNIGGGDYLEFEVCANCGYMVGEWPLPIMTENDDEDEDA